MKKVGNWWFPDQEEHFIEWMANPKNRVVINGRESYQGKKQLAVLAACEGRDGVAIDVGGHIGTWAFNLKSHFYAVHSFEPVPEHRACFEKNVLGLCSPEIVTLHPYALGDHAGHVSIRVDPKSTGGSYVSGKGDAEMRTLDSFEFTDVDLIKIDCEGYEEFVLRGAVETVKRWKPVICVEAKRDMAVKFGLEPQGAIRYLKKLGYRVAEEIGGDYIMVPA